LDTGDRACAEASHREQKARFAAGDEACTLRLGRDLVDQRAPAKVVIQPAIAGIALREGASQLDLRVSADMIGLGFSGSVDEFGFGAGIGKGHPDQPAPILYSAPAAAPKLSYS
jgi:hypothetical protein